MKVRRRPPGFRSPSRAEACLGAIFALALIVFFTPVCRRPPLQAPDPGRGNRTAGENEATAAPFRPAHLSSAWAAADLGAECLFPFSPAGGKDGNGLPAWGGGTVAGMHGGPGKKAEEERECAAFGDWRQALQPGDILLGRCRLSFVPSADPFNGWTHVALYAGDGDLLVAANPRQGVMRASLESWSYPRMTWVVCLRVRADPGVREGAVRWAEERVGLPYDLNWLSKQEEGCSWYCSEYVWAAYLHASDGDVNLEHGPDDFGVSPDEILMDGDTEVIGGHFERSPDTLQSLLMKLMLLCIPFLGMTTGETRRRRARGG